MTSGNGKTEGTAMSPRAVIYVRISRDKEGAGLGVAEQERQCRTLAERSGYTVVGAAYVDNDVSAYSGKPRPGYQRMLADLAAGKAQRVVAWHTDRLHRSNTELEDYINVVEPRGIVTETVKAGPIDLATPTGRMVARQLCAIARYESEHRAERVSAARARQARQGKYGGGKRPYGFEPDGVTVRPAEAAVIIRVGYALLSGVSLRAIAADLRKDQTPTTDGRRWQTSTVRSVLLRPRNAGFMVHRPAKTPDRPRGIYSDEEIMATAPWAPILPEDAWRAIVAKLTDPDRTTTTGPAPKWLGSGIYQCPCGGVMRGSKATGNNRYPIYRCQERGKGHVRISAADADAYVRLVVIERLSRPDAVKLVTPASSGPSAAELYAQLAVHRERLEEIAADREADRITRSQYLLQTESRRAKISEVEEQIAATAQVSPLAPLIDAEDVARAWDALSLGERRAALRALMAVTIKPVGSGHRNVPARHRVHCHRSQPARAA
ncbi:recombinase family protein [Spirillospora sp. CA-108201]